MGIRACVSFYKMARQAREKSQTGIYHIMWRGANRQEIFHDDQDRIRFLDYLDKYKEKAELSVYGWCLMNNHVHLLLKEGSEPISNTMHRIGVCYVGYYNWKYKTTGSLFQNRFKSECVESYPYLMTVIRYIHQNPLKAGMVKRVGDWEWSSCLAYYDQPIYPRKLLDSDFILKLYSGNVKRARRLFQNFNEFSTQDECLDDDEKIRLTDDEARVEIKRLLNSIEIAQVKSLPRDQRDELIRQVKQTKGISQRQAARILGISPSLVNKA